MPDHAAANTDESPKIDVVLTDEQCIAVGQNRSCYLHPQNHDLCIKVDKPLGEGRNNTWPKRLRRRVLFWLPDISSNRSEARFYQQQRQRIGDDFYRHAPRFEGAVSTNLGPGLAFELIRDSDGQMSRRLADCLAGQPQDVEQFVDLVDELYAFVRQHDVPLFDPNLHNLLVQRRSDQRDRLVVIDWKGGAANRELIPLSTLLPTHARRKVTRRFERIRKKLRTRAAAALSRSA